jgi:branched-chain amino acid transport system substrate-binding protein
LLSNIIIMPYSRIPIPILVIWTNGVKALTGNVNALPEESKPNTITDMKLLKRPGQTDSKYGERRLAQIASVFLIMSLTVFQPFVDRNADAAQPLKIGVSLPLSGDAQILGEQFLSGAQLAVETFAENGEIELIAADDGCDPDLGELAAQDLTAANVSIVIGYLCNEPIRNAGIEFMQSGVPIIISGARAGHVIDDALDEGWNVWRMAPGNDYGANAAYEILSRRWQGQTWALVDDGTIYGRNLSDILRARMEEAGQPPHYVDTLRPAQSSQGSLVRRLRQAGVSAVFVAGAASDIAVLQSDAIAAGAEFEIAGGETLSLLPWIETREPVADGLLAIMEPQPMHLPAAGGLSNVMLEAGINPDPHVLLGYASAELAISAIRATPEETTKTIERTVFRTIIGYVDFDETRRNRINHYSLYIWEDGRFREMEENTN